ncbi:ABC transporter permease [Vibrio chagasii]|uniref:hypothetical protein n=1 Tax=Vibrio chagasii TaxID=170679 RepID=UPI0035A6164F
MINLKGILLTISFVFVLSGCDVKESYNDDSCIKTLNDLRINGEYSYSKATGDVCHSLDISARKYKSSASSEAFIYPYSENAFLHEDTAQRYNTQAIQKNESAQSQIKKKEKIMNLSLVSIPLLICLVLFLLHTYFYQDKKQSKKNSVIQFILFFSILWFLVLLFTYAEYAQIAQVRSSIWSANKVARITMISELKKDERTSTQVLANSTDNEALKDIMDFNKLFTCISNNQIYHIETRQYWFDHFKTDKDLSEFYYRKNVPYIIDVDKSDERKIGYRLGKVGQLVGIEVKNCGDVKFPVMNISESLFDKMIKIKLKDILHNAITQRKYAENLELIKNAYITEYGSTIPVIRDYEIIIDFFSQEYLKGVIFGSIKTEGKYNKQVVIERNFDNLYELQSNSEKIVENIKGERCIANGEFLKKTKESVQKYFQDSDEDRMIHQFDCVSFENDTVAPISSFAYRYEDNESIVKSLVEDYRSSSNALAKQQGEYLKAEYVKVAKGHLKALEGFTSHEMRLVHLYNQGGEAQSEFISFIKRKSNEHTKTYARLIDVSMFDISQALPDFTADDEPMVETTISMVNEHLASLIDQIDLDIENMSNDITSTMLEYNLDDSTLLDNALEGNTKAIKASFTNYADNAASKLNRINRFVCNGDVETCNDVQDDFDGVREWNQSLNDMREEGTKLLTVGLTAYGASTAISAFLDFGKHNDKNNIKATFGKSSKVLVFKSLIDVIKAGAKLVTYLGAALIIASAMMEFIYFIPSIVSTFYYATQYYFFEYFIYSAIFFLSVSLMTSFSVEKQKKMLLRFIMMYFSPIFMSAIIPIVSYLFFIFVELILNYLPTISSMNLIDSGDSLITKVISLIFGYFALIIVVPFVILFMYKYIISSAAQVMSHISKENSLAQGSQMLDRGKDIAMFASGATVAKKVSTIDKQNKRRKKQEEKNKREE